MSIELERSKAKIIHSTDDSLLVTFIIFLRITQYLQSFETINKRSIERTVYQTLIEHISERATIVSTWINIKDNRTSVIEHRSFLKDERDRSL